ncbi:Wadjet anti-phage system protein JetD domain-containing protein [Bifidobacterium catenulatum subsp. kashiwanohense]|uniref:Wadjet anti-phage system protein JetD domain-containing protein n=1 Tax=Bifidobacterium catenulatum TaxID=1686 RepID=UPI003D073A49
MQNIRTIRHQTRQKKQPLKTRDPKPTPGLTQHERNLYEQLCTGKNTTYLRIEQERIPINDAMTILHNQHQWNTTHHK